MEKKRYFNEKENKWHTEGRGITRRIDTHTIFSGVPTEAQLKEWGYEEHVEPQIDESNDEDLELAQGE